MAPGSRCTAIVLEMQPILPWAPQFAHSNSLFCSILKTTGYTVQDSLVFWSTTSGALRSTQEVVSEHLGAHHFAFSLSGSIWKDLEGSVWLFTVAELFWYNFQTILHCADAWSHYTKYTLCHSQLLVSHTLAELSEIHTVCVIPHALMGCFHRSVQCVRFPMHSCQVFIDSCNLGHSL